MYKLAHVPQINQLI